MSDTSLHLTMRELQRLFGAPQLWAALAGVALLAGLVGPFGTYEQLGLPARIAYWTAVVVPTWFAGLGTVFILTALFTPDRPPHWATFALFGAAGGLPVALVVHVLNGFTFGAGAIGFVTLLIYCVAISSVVSALVALLVTHIARLRTAAERVPEFAPVTPATAMPRARILERLPPHLRGTLSHMTMQDHYVDIRTDRGGALVLMRLADAIAEADGIDGLQIHRSHWVAVGQVAGQLRRGDRLVLKMADGTELPVSRSYLAAVKARAFA